MWAVIVEEQAHMYASVVGLFEQKVKAQRIAEQLRTNLKLSGYEAESEYVHVSEMPPINQMHDEVYSRATTFIRHNAEV